MLAGRDPAGAISQRYQAAAVELRATPMDAPEITPAAGSGIRFDIAGAVELGTQFLG
jgi:hypothetical protein